MILWSTIADHIGEVTGQSFVLEHQRSVSGGSINQAYTLSGGDRTYFVKVNRASQLSMFLAEVFGLREIARTQTVRVPEPLCWGTAGSSAYLVLTWLDLGRGTDQAWNLMGQQLAAMHRVTTDRGYGWGQNNTIGSTPQINNWTPDWVTFFTEHRLGYQFRLARQRGGDFPQQPELLATIPKILGDHYPLPALVHGDLWSGNVAVTQAGEPVLLDPAAYYGDREVDLAMSELFGRFPQAFYQGYQAAFPLTPGYERRRVLYNLYHILNHFNLFGGSYEFQTNAMIRDLLG